MTILHLNNPDKDFLKKHATLPKTGSLIKVFSFRLLCNSATGEILPIPAKPTVKLIKREILFEQRNTRKDLAWAAAHNPFFVHGKHEKRGKFVGLLL